VLAKTARTLLAAGITSVRDVGSYDDEAIALREAVRLEIVEGPRILSCGRIISATAPGGAIFKTMYREADGPDDQDDDEKDASDRSTVHGVELSVTAALVRWDQPRPVMWGECEDAAETPRGWRTGTTAGPDPLVDPGMPRLADTGILRAARVSPLPPRPNPDVAPADRPSGHLGRPVHPSPAPSVVHGGVPSPRAGW
jgi:hypothetical protein